MSFLGEFVCTGYNRLPKDTDEKTADAKVTITITENVSVVLGASSTKQLDGSIVVEADFGKNVTFSCVAEGGRTPFFMVNNFFEKYQKGISL